MKPYAKLTLVLGSLWFLAALSASALHLFENASSRLGGAVAVGAIVPLFVFFGWFGVSRKFRDFVMSWNPTILTAAQSGRIIGFTFVLLEAHRGLPAIFALPAGYGDMAIGATATIVAWKLANPGHRNTFILWQLLGIADLVTAVALGTTAGLLDPHGVPMLYMTTLPLSLVPTFLVPLYLIFHVVCIAQATPWALPSLPAHQIATSTPIRQF